MPRSNALSVTSVPPRGRRTDCPSPLLVIVPAYRSSSAVRPFDTPPPEGRPAGTAPTAWACPTRSTPDSAANGSEKTRGGICAMPGPRCLSAVPVPASACRRWSIGARFLTQPRSRRRRCRSSKRSAESTPLPRELGVCASREQRGAGGRDRDYYRLGQRAESRNASAYIHRSDNYLPQSYTYGMYKHIFTALPCCWGRRLNLNTPEGEHVWAVLYVCRPQALHERPVGKQRHPKQLPLKSTRKTE